ncbi:MAG: HEAT repeat domain-containing protein [Myxococcales bacterium]|nr:HEAT repeat domain-containing protein [Myxococcales bacterium]
MSSFDYSWSEAALHVCRCGTMFPTRRWRWIDADARAGVAERVRRRGPWEGECPECGELASGHATWLCVRPGAKRVELVMHPSRRGDVLDEMRDHLERVRSRGEAMPTWVLAPAFEFVEAEEAVPVRREETTARRPYSEVAGVDEAEQTGVRREPSRPVPAATPPAVGLDGLDDEPRLIDPSHLMDVGEEEAPVLPSGRSSGVPSAPLFAPPSPGSVPDFDAGVPQLIGSDAPSPPMATRPSAIGAHVADLTLDEVVTFRVRVSSEELPRWEAAHLSARPIHLRGYGYPLVGVRVVGSYMGQVGCIDAVVDVGSALATDVFRRLSERFAVTLVIEHGSREVSREIVSEGLEPNAALCVESARGILARGEYPPQEFDKARRVLEAEPAPSRLVRPEVSLASGAYQHIIGAREAVAALEHLERVSQKDTLAQLLEVEGLPMAEYDEIRRRVLEGSLTHGLCAPRRFWRRLVASGLARDLDDYAQRLSANRAEHEGEEGDLEPDAAHEAWLSIHDLCRRKDIPPPTELRRALSLPEPELVPASPPPPPRRQVSGEIRSGEITSGTLSSDGPPGVPEQLEQRLRDPRQRLRAATEVLQGRGSLEALGQVIASLEEFETGELLALLPDLSDLGPRVVPGLLEKLGSESREVRQAAAILLGMSREPEAMQRLSEHLVREPTTVWLDVARAIGWFGTAAIRGLCQTLSQEAASPGEQLAIDRVARALAEIAVSQDSGQDTQTGKDAVRALADADDPRVSTAARRALSSLAEVTTSGAQIRGEIPMSEVTEIRAFARRAYEAIMVPELEVEAEA